MTPKEKLNLEITADGSVTLYREDIDEHYHSVKGALAESRHIYFGLGWQGYLPREETISVFEVGYGTGLNAALTAKATLEAGIHTEYRAVELYPLDTETVRILTDCQPSELRDIFGEVNSAPWDRKVEINPLFTLHKIKADLRTMVLPRPIDIVYFDAFAPEKQPDMWDEQIFRALYQAMVPGGRLTTYCAKGAIRRLLEKTGFLTERLPGPPSGKREVLRATKPDPEK